MRKSIIIFVTILALVSFGTASSVYAFEPISTITLIVGGTALGLAALRDKVDENKAQSVQIKDNKGGQKEKQVRNEADNVKEAKRDLSLSAG